MARRRSSSASRLVLCTLILCWFAKKAKAQSMFTLSWSQIALPGTEHGFIFSMQVNPQVNMNPDNPHRFDASLVRVNMPPCGVRTMHIHRNTDELHYITQGTMLGGVALPNGTVVRDTVMAGQSFVAPANYIHSLSNPSCTARAEFLGFYNHFDPAITNVIAGAFNMPGGPIQAYADQVLDDSFSAALGLFAFDPVCLHRCRLGPRGGQLPCDPASGIPCGVPGTGR